MLVSSTPSVTPNSLNMANPKNIFARSSAGGAIVYTVPANRKFVGYITGINNSSECNLQASGSASSPISIPSTATSFPQMVLISGTIVSVNNTTYGVQVNGVESDL